MLYVKSIYIYISSHVVFNFDNRVHTREIYMVGYYIDYPNLLRRANNARMKRVKVILHFFTMK